MKNILQIAVVFGLALSLSTVAFGEPPFSMNPVPGSSPDTLTAINNSSQVVVNVGTATSYDVLVWSRSAGSENLELSGVNSGGAAINNSGDVVGAGDPDNSGVLQAFIWQPVGGVQWLGSLGGGLSAASGVNDSGAVVGLSYTAAETKHAFLWTQAGGMEDLTPDLTSTGGATAVAVNSSNQVVGYYFPNGSRTALGFSCTQGGGWQDLGSAGTLALAVNDAGTVVGQAPNANGYKHAFSWTQGGGMTDLGTLGGAESTALGINNKGWIVGTSLTSSGNGMVHGFLWTPGRGLTDLAVESSLTSSVQVYAVQVNDYGVLAVSTNKGLSILIPKMKVTITSSPNPSVLGQPVTFTAKVSSIAGPPPDGETVEFTEGGNPLGSATLNNGVARLTTSAIPVGSHIVDAMYTGDANYLASGYAPVRQVVNP